MLKMGRLALWLCIVFLTSDAESQQEQAFQTKLQALQKEKEGGRFIPPIHLQQLNAALVGKGEKQWKNREAIDMVLMANIATDLVALKEDFGGLYLHVILASYFSVKEGDRIYTKAKSLIPKVTALATRAPFCPKGTDGFHFDNLFHYKDIVKRWKQLEEWTKQEVGKTQISPSYWHEEGRDNFLLILGMTSHMVQDFYAHSSWIGCIQDFYKKEMRDPQFYPIWEEIQAYPQMLALLEEFTGSRPSIHAMKSFPHMLALLQTSDMEVTSEEEYAKGRIGGLQTGRWNYDGMIGGKLPWKHREPEGKNEIIALELSARSTFLWKEKLLSSLAEWYRKDLEDHIYDRFQEELKLNQITLEKGSFSRKHARVYFILKKNGIEVYNGREKKKVYSCSFPGTYSLQESFNIPAAVASQYRLEIWHDSYLFDKHLATPSLDVLKKPHTGSWNFDTGGSLEYSYEKKKNQQK